MTLSLAHQLWLKNATVPEIVRKITEGVFTLEQLRAYARKNAAFAIKFDLIETSATAVEDPDEQDAYRHAVEAYTDAPGEEATVRVLEAYIARWNSLPSAAGHITEIRGCLSRIKENAAFAAVEKAMEAYEASDGKVWRPVHEEIESYLTSYADAGYAAGHVSAVRRHKATLGNRIAAVAESEWQKLFDANGRLNNLDDIDGFLKTFKGTGTYSAKADEAIWEWALTADDVVNGVRCYENFYRGCGHHSAEAPEARNAESEWLMIDSDNIYDLLEFTEFYPDHIFHRKAEDRIRTLKDKELAELHRAPALYDNQTFCALYEKGVCTKEELCEASGADDAMFERILNDSRIRSVLPAPPGPDCRYAGGTGEAGLTDIILFGIAASGKTSVMTGLLSSENVAVDEVNYSGEYASLLKSYSRSGIAISGTPDDFVAVVKGTIRSGAARDNSFNFVEMAGEAFTNKIVTAVGSDGHVITEFRRMGNSASEILSNDNEKLIFLLIDPTCDEAGRQEQIKSFNRLRSLMFDVEANREVMRRVKGLHFIVTKADTLGENREDKAVGIVHSILNKATRDALIEQCAECGINASPDASANGLPRIFCFSLGRFNVGNIYTYDPADSEGLLSVICNYTSGERARKTIFRPRRNFFN